MPLISLTAEGLYCEAGGFHIDPWRPVPRAVITHAHSDHASSGHEHYLVAKPGEHVARRRLGDAHIETIEYGAAIDMNGLRVSLHPAGHVLGSLRRCGSRTARRIVGGPGDYKFRPIRRCLLRADRVHNFITESTFGLRFTLARTGGSIRRRERVGRNNRGRPARASIYAYALGKAQRLLMSIDPSIGPIYTHGAVEALNEAYRASGVNLPATQRVSDMPARGFDYSRALIVAPPSAQSTPWLRRFGDYADAFASGWMQIRGVRRRRAVDRVFAFGPRDWPGLRSDAATGAQRLRDSRYIEQLVCASLESGVAARHLTRFTANRHAETDPAHAAPTRRAHTRITRERLG